ncbi:MAG: hypothetical protein H6737_04960 [Alphaproteobacteria bacterium]|nr:hypothetical protein [Alphaproteobacteria bacterium]
MRWFTLLALVACKGGSDEPPGLADNFGVVADQGTEGCDNLVPTCLYPFPSRAYLVDGALRLPPEGMPVPASSTATYNTGEFDRYEAFGAATPILFQLPGAVPANDHIFDPEPSLQPDSPVVLLDATTGERIPHWLEGDFLSPDLDPPLFVIRPSIALPRGTEIVVGVRGLSDASGTIAPATEAFAALRDREAAHWIGVHERRQHYEDVVFPALEAAGVDRSELQLAWSFPVRTDEAATSRLVAIRDAIFTALPSDGPSYRIDSIIECPGLPDDPPDCHPSIRVIVDGVSFVPSVVGEPNDIGVRRLRLDANGEPVVQGTEEWPWRLQIPHVAFDGPEPVPVLQYGHGFLGRMAEVNNGWIREMAERKGVALLACDMQGMNENDFTTWLALMLGAAGDFPALADLAMQGTVNQLVQQRMVKTSLAEDASAELYRADGRLAWDPDTVWYHGNSQGGSVGTVVMGLSLDVQRGDLGVPGSGYPLLLHRSTVFTSFGLAIQGAYPEDDSIARFLTLLGTGFDDFDPLTFSPHMHGNPLPGTPDHEVLFHIAKEDQQVVNEASFISARTAGAVLMVPAVRPVWGLPEQTYPATPGVAAVEVDFGIPDDENPVDPPTVRPELEDDGDTHGWLRKWEPAQDQMIHFFQTGEMVDVCGGQPCYNDGEP